MFFLGGAQHCCALLRCTDVHRPPDCHSERSRPTFSLAFAPAKASPCGCEESLFLFLFAPPPSPLHKHHAIIILRPITGNLLHFHSPRPHLLHPTLFPNPIP